MREAADVWVKWAYITSPSREPFRVIGEVLESLKVRLARVETPFCRTVPVVSIPTGNTKAKPLMGELTPQGILSALIEDICHW